MQHVVKHDMTIALDAYGLPVDENMKVPIDRQKVRWARGKDFQSWTTVQIVSTDIWMNDLVQRNKEKIIALENETEDVLQTVHVVAGRPDGETSADGLRDAVDRLKNLHEAGMHFHKALESDIMTARQHSLKTMKELNKLGPRLVKTTNRISKKVHETQTMLHKQSF